MLLVPLLCLISDVSTHSSSVETLDDTYHPPIEKEFPTTKVAGMVSTLGESNMDRAKIGMYQKHLLSSVRKLGAKHPMILGSFGG